MRLYLAAAWSRKDEISEIAKELNKISGIEVQARWISEPKSEYGGSNVTEFRRDRALIDVEDVGNADVLVRFTDDLSREVIPAGLATGARMFEMGYAWSLGKKIIVVGGYQPIFDYLPGITHVRDVEELKRALREGVCKQN
jgi:hypothetical protein